MIENARSAENLESIMGMARGFQASRVLLTAAQLDLFTHLADGGRTAEQVAQAAGTDPSATERLLDALVALGLVRKQGASYTNTPAAQQYLVRGAPGSVLAALEHSANVWDRWNTLTEVVRTGKVPDLREINDRSTSWLESFIGAMDVFSRATAPKVAAEIGLQGVKRMLDVGGGGGSYAITCARAKPDLTATVFDLPNVMPITHRTITAAGMEGRVTAQPGDFRTDPLPGGFDLVLLSAIVHMNSPEENIALLRKCFGALNPGGRVVIRDFVMSENRTEPASGALFAINMLVNTAGGGTYTETEMRSWLEAAGFVDVTHKELPEPNGLMVGTHP